MPVRKKLFLTTLACLLPLLAGCTVGPDFRAPDAPKDTRYNNRELPAKTISTPVTAGQAQSFDETRTVQTDWWTRFQSDKLNQLIAQALKDSPTIAAAQATLQQARLTWQAQSGSTELPHVDLTAGAQRQLFNPAAFGQPGNSSLFNLYNAGVQVGYLFDLFGGNRRALEALAAQTEYQQHELDAARLTLAGNIATAAMTQAALRAQLMAVSQLIAQQEEQLNITRRREAIGAVGRNDVLALESQLAQTRAQVPPLMNRLSQTNHLLAALAGQTPAGFEVPGFELDDFTLPASVPVVVPSTLLQSRPDIAAAQALLHAATAQYGNAISTALPQINLSAGLSQESLTTGTLFNPASTIWSLAGSLTQPLFNGGLHSAINAVHASLDAADANYRATVVQAFRNVADALRALDNDAKLVADQYTANQAAQQSWELTRQQYQLGSVPWLQVLVAGQQADQTRINLIQAQAQRLTDTAALYQAMGGASAASAAQPPVGLAEQSQPVREAKSQEEHP